MVPMATALDVQDRLGRPLADGESSRVQALLVEGSAIVEAHIGRSYDSADVPSPVAIVVSRMVARVLQQGDDRLGVQSESQGTGPFSRSRTYDVEATTGGPWLTKLDKQILAPWARSNVSLETATDHA